MAHNINKQQALEMTQNLVRTAAGKNGKIFIMDHPQDAPEKTCSGGQ